MKWALRLAGAVALLGGLAIAVAGCIAYWRLPGAAEPEALTDTLDAMAIGAFGALFGVGLIVWAGGSPRSGG